MGIAEPGTAFDGQAPEHEQILDYMGSSAWETRLAEARARREKVLAAREAATGKDARRPGVAQFADTFALLEGPGSPPPPPVMPDPPAAVPVPMEPSADETADAGTDKPAAAPEGARTRRRAAGILAGVVAVTVPAVALLAISLRDPATELTGPAPSSTTEVAAPSGVPTIAPPAASGAGDAAPTLALVVAELGAGYEVSVVAPANGSPLPAAFGDAPVETRRSSFSFPAPTVVFFHGADGTAASRISDRLGAELLDLTGLRPSPPAGTLEIHLPES